MGFIKFTFDGSTLFVETSRNFEGVENFIKHFQKEITNLSYIGTWGVVVLDIDSGVYETNLVVRSNENIHDFLINYGYKYTDDMYIRKISITKRKKNNKNYSKKV